MYYKPNERLNQRISSTKLINTSIVVLIDNLEISLIFSTKFEELNEYLKYEPVKTYIRFITNRYKPVLINYDKYDLVSYCNEVLNKCKKINKGRV